jgi:hypothetical protein
LRCSMGEPFDENFIRDCAANARKRTTAELRVCYGPSPILTRFKLGQNSPRAGLVLEPPQNSPKNAHGAARVATIKREPPQKQIQVTAVGVVHGGRRVVGRGQSLLDDGGEKVEIGCCGRRAGSGRQADVGRCALPDPQGRGTSTPATKTCRRGPRTGGTQNCRRCRASCGELARRG